MLNKKEKYILIIGCGRLGAGLADAISDGKGDVMVIDKEKDAFRRLSSSYGGMTMTGDASDIDVLLEADVAHAAAVLAVTDNDNVNICISQLVKEAFGVPHVIARLYDADRKCVYNEQGIDVICPAELSVREIGRLLNQKAEGRKAE